MRRRAQPGPQVEPGRLGVWQLVFLLVTIVAIEDSTAVDHWLDRRVGQDAWISILAALPVIACGVWTLVSLANRHPGLDLAGILLRVAGPLAYPIGLLYVALFLADATLSLRQYGTLSRLLSFMNLTPYAAFAAGLALTAVYGAWLGIEVLARVNAAALLFIDVPLGILLSLLAVNHQQLARALPVLAHGWGPVLWGIWLVVGKFGQFVLLLVFLPLVAEGRPRAARSILWGVAMASVIALGHTMGAVMTFGGSVQTIEWPAYSEVRTIDIARFIANLDWIAVVLWTHGFLIEVAVFIYAAALTLARLFGARSHRPFLPPLGAAVLVASFLCARDQAGLLYRRWLLDAWGFVALGWVLPLALLGWSAVRGLGTAHPALGAARRESASALPRPALRGEAAGPAGGGEGVRAERLR